MKMHRTIRSSDNSGSVDRGSTVILVHPLINTLSVEQAIETRLIESPRMFQDQVLLGLCLPSSCTKNEISVIMQKIFHDRTLLSNYLYSADFNLFAISDLTDDFKWLLDGPKIIILYVIRPRNSVFRFPSD